MTDYKESQAKRDKSLVNRSANAADNFSLYLKTWIQEEIIALYPRVNALADSKAPEPIKREHERALKVLEELDRYELNDEYDKFRMSLTDIQDGVYETCLEAHQYVQDALSGLERVVRRLLRVRSEIDLWDEPPRSTTEQADDEAEGGT
jgi:hypothetical protein